MLTTAQKITITLVSVTFRGRTKTCMVRCVNNRVPQYLLDQMARSLGAGPYDCYLVG